jgi:ATP-dependent DNA helicase RecG
VALPVNINALLGGNLIESERIEFKQGWNPGVILRTICAFANDLHNVGGGYVVVGVNEVEGVAQLPPVGLPENSLDITQQELLQICHYIQPDYFPVVHPAQISGKYILVIWCPPGQHRPYKAPKTLGKQAAFNKPYYVRRMSSTVEAKGIDEQQLLDYAAHQRTPFDNQVNYHASISDINLVHVATFLQEIKSDLYQDLPTLPVNDLCRQMRIASGADENLYPLNIALLMFTDRPYDYLRGARIELVEYLDAVGDKFRESYFEGPIWLQLKEVLTFIKNQVIKEQVVKIKGQAEAQRFYNYPFEAIEETVANAVFHKGYDKQNPIEINIRHDRIEVSSFPGPLPPVNQAMLNRDRVISRDCRNTRLGDFLKELDLTEGRGTGIPKIRANMNKNGSPAPHFITDDNNTFFVTELLIHPQFVQDTDQVTDQVTDRVTDQVMNLLACLQDQPLSSVNCMQKLELKHRPSFRKSYITPALSLKLIEMTIPDSPNSRLQKYRLTRLGSQILQGRKE